MRVSEEKRELRDRMIDEETQRLISCDWVKEDAKARAEGQTEFEWSGESCPLIGDEVVVFDGCIGTVCDYSIHLPDVEDVKIWERCVWVKLSSGGFIKATGHECEVMTELLRDGLRHRQEEMKQKLEEAGRKVERQKKERRSRVVVGSHLLDEMLRMASSVGLCVDENKSFHKITGTVEKRAVYIATKGGRVDLSGFDIDHPSCNKISEDDAKQRHLGRVRGQLDFSKGDVQTIEAFEKALKELE